MVRVNEGGSEMNCTRNGTTEAVAVELKQCEGGAEANCTILNIFLSQYLTSLLHKICFTIGFISCLCMFRAHVLIIRRSKSHYTVSGIITPIGNQLDA